LKLLVQGERDLAEGDFLAQKDFFLGLERDLLEGSFKTE
jgi:hypothetical protein